MTGLVQRWASLEPERCRVEDSGAHLGPPYAFFIRWSVLTADPLNPAIVLAAVIEAVEARGWGWALSGTPRLKHSATIGRLGTGRPESRDYSDHHANTPAAALLGAYLAALEAEAGQ